MSQRSTSGVLGIRRISLQEDFWVDDFIGIGSGEDLDALAKSVDAKYGITGLGDVKWVLGMLIERERAGRTIYISQEAFINSISTRFHLTDAAPLSTLFVFVGKGRKYFTHHNA